MFDIIYHEYAIKLHVYSLEYTVKQPTHQEHEEENVCMLIYTKENHLGFYFSLEIASLCLSAISVILRRYIRKESDLHLSLNFISSVLIF